MSKHLNSLSTAAKRWKVEDLTGTVDQVRERKEKCEAQLRRGGREIEV